MAKNIFTASNNNIFLQTRLVVEPKKSLDVLFDRCIKMYSGLDCFRLQFDVSKYFTAPFSDNSSVIRYNYIQHVLTSYMFRPFSVIFREAFNKEKNNSG